MLGHDFEGLCYTFRICYSEGNGKIIGFQEDLMTFSLSNNVNRAWQTEWGKPDQSQRDHMESGRGTLVK